MYIVKIVKYSINKRIREYKQSQIWREHGEETKYHLVDSCYKIGEFTYGIPSVYRYDPKVTLSIGNYCSIAGGVEILLGGEHHLKRVSTYPFFRNVNVFPESGGWTERVRGNIKIGNDVWIGRNALILSGVTIGDGAVIGAGAVVSKDIPPYAIAVGNPIKVIKYRFEEAQIKALEKIQWWNWDVKKINKYMKYFCSENIDGFIEEQLGSNWKNEL